MEEDSRELDYLEGGEVGGPPGMKPEAGAEIVEVDRDMTEAIDENGKIPRGAKEGRTDGYLT